jgi:histone deacetylase HOS3
MSAIDSTEPLGLFIQPACLQHKYIRHPNSSHIFERPERLRAVLLGVAAAVARLEEAEAAVATALGPSTQSSSSSSTGASAAETKEATSNGDDLSSLLSGLSINVNPISGSSFQPPNHLSIITPPPTGQPGQILLHHPALQFAHSPASSDLIEGMSAPSSTYLRDLHKWASEAVEMIKTTGCEIPSGKGLNQGDLYLGPGSILAIEGAVSQPSRVRSGKDGY